MRYNNACVPKTLLYPCSTSNLLLTALTGYPIEQISYASVRLSAGNLPAEV